MINLIQLLFRKIRHTAIIRNLDIPENSSVLDTSCGDGGFLKVLLGKNKDKNLNIFGIDIDAKEISKAKKLLPQASLVVTDNKAIPFPDKSFDIVISSMTLHHMANPADSLKEMQRVLKDGGSIYLVDLMAKSKVFYTFLKHIKCPEPYYFNKFYLLKDVEVLMQNAGLEIESSQSITIFPAPSIAMPVLIIKVGVLKT